MTGRSGTAWADIYDSRPIDRSGRYGDLTFDEAEPWFDAVGCVLAKASPVTVQIGCSSGREMEYFAIRFPAISFIGTDIDTGIIERARKRHALPNLTFEVARAHEIAAIAPGRELLIYSNGSLQYVQPEHLALMFSRLKARGNCSIILGEPWQQSTETLAHSRWRGNFSYSHDYRYYAEVSGLKIIEQRTIRTHLDPSHQHFNTFHYFMYAR